MAHQPTPRELCPDELQQLRNQRANGADFSLEVGMTLELTNVGPRTCLFQKAHKFDVGPEQMIAVSPQTLFMAATQVQAAMYGLTVQWGRMAVPGMTPDGQPVAPTDPNAPHS